MEKRTIKSAKLYKEDDKYYLDLTYRIEKDRKIEEMWIPKVRLPIEKGTCGSFRLGMQTAFVLDCSNSVHLPLEERKDEYGEFAFRTMVVEELPEELTIEEIEKRLGHKIRIVNNKKDDI